MKTLLKIFLTAFAAATINPLMAQTTVKGIISDSLSNESVPFATVAVTKEGEINNFAMTAISDVDGSFSGVVKGKGNFIITMRSTGKKPIIKNFTLKGEKVYDFGKILMQDLIDTLGTVEVVAVKQLVTAEAGKMKYNAEADPENKTSTVLDMLRKVPMVTVDGQDNITINGNSSFQVFVNGKKNTMLTAHPSETLKAMPASGVKNIEVITDPGAKYDAEGAGGIINLITDKKTKMNQTAGNIRAEKGTVRESYGGDFSIQKGKFAASVNGVLFRGNNDLGYHNTNIQKLSEGDVTTETDFSAKMKQHYGEIGTELSYDIDTLNLISVNGGYSSWGQNRDGIMNYAVNGMFAANNYSETENGYDSYWAGLDYQHTFKSNPMKMLTFSYKMWNGENISNEKTSIINDGTSSYYDFSGRKYDNSAKSGEHTFQIDYSTPLSQTMNLETGAKYILRPKHSIGDNYQAATDGNYVYDDAQSVDFKYVDNIAAVYAEMSKQIKKFNLKGGLRYEYTFLNADYKKGNGEDFSKDYGNLVPSFAATYAISMQQNVNFTYNMRIARPNESQLNPFHQTTPLMVSYGNTGLECEKVHNFGISYGYFSQRQSVNINLRHSFCKNGISQYMFYYDDLLNSTYDNFTENANTSLNVYYNINISKKARFFTNLSANYVDLNNDKMPASNSGFSGNGYSSFMYTFPADVKASIGCFFSTKNYQLQGENTGLCIGNFSVAKSFFKERLNITCSGNISLNHGKYLKFNNFSEDKDYRTNTEIKFKFANLGISASWRFGGNVNVKKTAKSINNDDFSKQQKSGNDTPSM